MGLRRRIASAAAFAASASLATAQPAAVAPDPLAQRLCDAVHTVPQTRRAQCCHSGPASTLAGECVRGLSASLADKAVSLVPAELDRCQAEAERSFAGCDWVRPLAPPPPPACRSVVHGQLAGGAHCRSSLECQDGLYCRGLGGMNPGVCGAPAPAGDSCATSVDALATYAGQLDYDSRHPACQGFCQKDRCVSFVSAGGACSANRQCSLGTHCASGRCAPGPLPKAGEACSGSSCAADAACVAGTCVALKAAGEACTSPFECRGACLKPAGARTGTCGMQCRAGSR